MQSMQFIIAYLIDILSVDIAIHIFFKFLEIFSRHYKLTRFHNDIKITAPL